MYADIEFHHFLRNVVDAGGWKPYVRAPRVSLVVLRRLCVPRTVNGTGQTRTLQS